MDLLNAECKNVRFVKLIERSPCLYDKSHPDFSRRNITDLVWSKISDQFKEPVIVCKEKWRNLRTVYVRNLHSQYRTGISRHKRRKYYLHDAMKFMEPFIKSLKHRSSYFSNPQREDLEDDGIPGEEQHLVSVAEGQEDQKDHIGNVYENSVIETVASSLQGPSQSESVCVSSVANNDSSGWLNDGDRLNELSREPMDTCFIEYGREMRNSKPIDTDEEFLHSLLPDVKLMGRKQKRRFKIEVLQLIDKIMDEEET